MPSKHLFIIRVALIAGVFTFAGIAIYQRLQGVVPPGLTGGLPVESLRFVLWALVGASALTTLFLRTRLDAATFTQRGLYTIVGWTFAEGVALLGVVMHFTGAPLTTLSLGLLAFVFALLILPVPRERS